MYLQSSAGSIAKSDHPAGASDFLLLAHAFDGWMSRFPPFVSSLK